LGPGPGQQGGVGKGKKIEVRLNPRGERRRAKKSRGLKDKRKRKEEGGLKRNGKPIKIAEAGPNQKHGLKSQKG